MGAYIARVFSFEKAISGMYVAELVRIVLCDLIKQKLIFVDQNTPKLFVPQAIPMSYVSIIEKFAYFLVHLCLIKGDRVEIKGKLDPLRRLD